MKPHWKLNHTKTNAAALITLILYVSCPNGKILFKSVLLGCGWNDRSIAQCTSILQRISTETSWHLFTVASLYLWVKSWTNKIKQKKATKTKPATATTFAGIYIASNFEKKVHMARVQPTFAHVWSDFKIDKLQSVIMFILHDNYCMHRRIRVWAANKVNIISKRIKINGKQCKRDRKNEINHTIYSAKSDKSRVFALYASEFNFSFYTPFLLF